MSRRFGSPRLMPKSRRKHKKARFLNRGIGFSYRKASRALNLRLAPLSNTHASARSVRLGLACRSCRFGVLLVSRRVDSVESIWSAAWVAIRSRVASIRSISSRFADFLLAFRPDSVDSLESCRVETRGANTKKARFLNREIGLSYRKASRALNLRLIPRANTRASVRSVLLGLARRSCIVMLTSDRRHIAHYI